MKTRTTHIWGYGLTALLVAAVAAWNLFEYFNTGLTSSLKTSLIQPPQASPSTANDTGPTDNSAKFDVVRFWKSFEQVRIEWDGNTIKTVSVPEDLQRLDGKIITVKAISLLTQDGLIRNANGCDVHRSLMLPPFGVIFCCSITPVPRYEWTIVVNSSEPWQIIGDIPNEISTIVTGRFRIAKEAYENGIFFIEDAQVRPCPKEEIEDYDNICL